jgi:single-stranded-DNA-specific exonuclease
MIATRLIERPVPRAVYEQLRREGASELMARLWAARGVRSLAEQSDDWKGLIPPTALTDVEQAARLLADAIERGDKLLIVGDFDCDGATATAVGVRALRSLGATVDYLVPNRFETGYGLSPAVVDLALQHERLGRPDLLITVDNGIASIEGVAHAKAHGIPVLVTDHHLPGDTLPEALAIVNPNRQDCGFPSKNLAGVGVLFYLMLALRAEMRRRGRFAPGAEPRLDRLLDLVALGTVADVVKLDANNRLLVAQGLRRIRAGQTQPGLAALLKVAGRSARDCRVQDLGFLLGPRLNAAGRLADMSLGIRLLVSDDPAETEKLAGELDRLNRERREIEQQMQADALDQLEALDVGQRASLCVFEPGWHQGVIGLVASRLKERYWRPVLAFAPAGDGQLKASGRSIPDVHLRDVLDLVTKRQPGLLDKFGGHAMAAGLSLRESNYAAFVAAFEAAVREFTGRDSFEPVLETDGSLPVEQANVVTAQQIEQAVWGAGFPAPMFVDEFEVLNQRLLQDKHLKLDLQRGGQRFDAIWFGRRDTVGARERFAYRLEVNSWNGQVRTQLLIEQAC